MAIEVPAGYTYLDWAATTPLCEEAAEAMAPFLAPGLANIASGMNANSLHRPGRAAFEQMELARRDIARCINASRPSEVVFTSGATEACNAAVLGIARAEAAKRRRGNGDAVLRVITTEIEHEAVSQPVDALRAEGFEVVRIKPDRQGFIHLEDLKDALGDNTVLVSIQAANSEIGSIQAIEEFVQAAHEAGALFHTDATQLLGKVAFDVRSLGIDAASFSAHKVCGPKGVGALYLKTRTPFEAIMLGGGQEEGRRSTTQNVCGIVGFAAALKAAVGIQESESQRQRGLRDTLYESLCKIPAVRATVDVETGSQKYLPNIVHVLVEGYESETLVLRLDNLGFGVSGGSACSSHSLEPSHVLSSLGVTPDEAYGALRISVGRYTTGDDIERFATALEQCIS